MRQDADRSGSTIDPREVDRFRRIADEWWDEHGKFRPLHRLGPVRLDYVRDALITHFGLPASRTRALEGLRLLDVGCGGGLISEPLARMGATVTGIDPGEENVAAARTHAARERLAIDYRATTAEALVAEGARFDAVICLEVIEHVPDVAAFCATLAGLARPGGLLVLSTLNRTLKSFGLAIVAAEYVMGWLPRGTHRWERFVTPDELDRHLAAAGLRPATPRGMVYNPLTARWSLAADTDVNYLLSAAKPG